MAKIDLIYSVPEELAESATLDDIVETVRGISDWQERHAQVLDYVYQYRLIRLLTTNASAKKFRTLNEHITRIINYPRTRQALNDLECPYAERWAAYRNILENRIRVLDSPAPEMIMERKHVSDILKLVEDAHSNGRELKQKDIQAKFDVKSPPNMTRVLKMMEAVGLIERRTRGREKIVVPGLNSDRVKPKDRQVDKPFRGLLYLIKEAA